MMTLLLAGRRAGSYIHSDPSNITSLIIFLRLEYYHGQRLQTGYLVSLAPNTEQVSNTLSLQVA
jgi:hypothetical protein